jgi:prophage regulatory protein
MNQLNRIVRQNELHLYCGLRRSQISQLISEGKFPPPIKLSARRKGWLESELVRWQQECIARRDGVPRK